MKECKDCGKKYSDELKECPRCGSMRTVLDFGNEQDEEIEFVPNFDVTEDEKPEVNTRVEHEQRNVKHKTVRAEETKTEVKQNNKRANKVISKANDKKEERHQKQEKRKEEIATATNKLFTKQFWIGLGIGSFMAAAIEFIILYATEIVKFY